MKVYEHILNQHEGWDVFDAVGGEADGEVQIQKLDEVGKFNEDRDAIRFVLAKACEGSKRHIHALHKLWNSPKEKEIVRKVAVEIGLSVDLPKFEHQPVAVWASIT